MTRATPDLDLERKIEPNHMDDLIIQTRHQGRRVQIRVRVRMGSTDLNLSGEVESREERRGVDKSRDARRVVVRSGARHTLTWQQL